MQTSVNRGGGQCGRRRLGDRSASDGAILVARAAVTDVQALAFAVGSTHALRAPVIGAVLNDIDFRRDATHDEAYRYYGHQETYAEHIG